MLNSAFQKKNEQVFTPSPFGLGIAAIPLTTIEPVDGEMTLLTGWGYTDKGHGSFAEHLLVTLLIERYVTRPIISLAALWRP